MAAFHRKSSHSTSKHALPSLWLFTDERVASTIILAAVARLPRESGIMFRHYATQEPERRALFTRIQKIAQRKGLMLLVGDITGNTYSEADGIHISLRHSKKPKRHTHKIFTASAHTVREIGHANRIGADLIFVSPVFPTRSHLRGRTLGPMRFATLARHAHMPVIALGGMNARRFQSITKLGCYGWAAIDALT